MLIIQKNCSHLEWINDGQETSDRYYSFAVNHILCKPFLQPVWKAIDPFDKYTDQIPLVFIMDNSYHPNRYADKISSENIGSVIGVVNHKTYFTPDENGESNHLEKGTELYEIIGEDYKSIIAIKYNEEYYEYVDSPWE